MTGRWVSPVGCDRTRPIVSGTLLEVTGRWGPASSHDLIDASGHEWNLTRNDRTLVLVRPVTLSSASSYYLNVLMTIEIGRSAFEVGDTWRTSHDRTLRFSVRSI